MAAAANKPPKNIPNPQTTAQALTKSQSAALIRRETTPTRSGFVIPAEYSRTSLLQALERIPDDH